MSSGDGAFQYVPLDKLKLYQNNLLFNNILRRLNFSNQFALLENPATDSVDIAVSSEIQGLGDLVNVNVVAPIAKQILKYDGTAGEWKDDFLNLDDLGDVTIPTLPQAGMSLRYDGTNWTSAFPFFDDLIDAVISNPQAQQVIRHNGITWLNAFLSGSDLSDFEITSPTTGQILRYDGTNFTNVAASAINLLLNDLADVIITTATTGQFLAYNGSNWVNTLIALDALSDVVIGTLSTGQTLQYNGVNWINVLLALDTLTDVTISAPTNGQVLKYNGTQWVNAPEAPGVVTLNDLSDVNTPSPAPGDIIRYDGAEWDNVSLNEILTLNALSDVSVGGATNGQVLTFSGGAWINQTPSPGGGGSPAALTDLTDVTITAGTLNDILRFDGTQWVDTPISELISLTQLSDVSITAPALAQVPRYNGSAWVNSLLNIDDLADAVITAPTSGQQLQYNGTNWVNTTSAASQSILLPDTQSGGNNWGIWTGGARLGTGFFAGCFSEGVIETLQSTVTGGKACTTFTTGGTNDDQAGFSGGMGAPAAPGSVTIRRDQNPRMKVRFQIPDITTIRFAIGWAAVNDLPVNTDDILATGVAGFLFYWSSAVAGITTVQIRRNDASGTAVIVDSPVTPAVNVPITLEIIADDANSRIGWRINESATTYYTTDIPAATTSMNYFVKTETKTDGPKTLTQYYAYIIQNPA